MAKMVSNEIMRMGNFLVPRPKGKRKIRKICAAGGCGGTAHGWRECLTPRQGNNLPSKLALAQRNLNSQKGEETQTSSPLPVTTREESP